MWNSILKMLCSKLIAEKDNIINDLKNEIKSIKITKQTQIDITNKYWKSVVFELKNSNNVKCKKEN